MDNRQLPIWSIEINENNIETFPQLSKEPFLPSIIERYRDLEDIFHKSTIDWYRDNPLLNNEHFRPENLEMNQKNKKKYFLSKLTGQITDEIIPAELLQEGGKSIKIEIKLSKQALTNDDDLNLYFGCLAHQDLMQCPEADLSRMLSLLSKSGDTKSIINSEPGKITHVKSFGINNFFNSTGKTVVEGNPAVNVIVTLEVYRDNDGIKHRYKYKLEAYNNNAEILLKKMLCPAYKLYAFLDNSNIFMENGNVTSQKYYASLNQMIDEVNQEIPDIKNIASEMIFPKLEDTTWNVYLVLGNLKKISNLIEEEIKNATNENKLLVTRKKCVDELYDKILETYQENIKSLRISALEANLNPSLATIFMKEIYHPFEQREKFNSTLLKFKIMVQTYKLVNNQEKTEQVIKEIIKDDINEERISTLKNILALEPSEEDDALSLFQQALIQCVKNSLLKKAKKFNFNVNVKLALLITNLEKSQLNFSDKNQILLKILDAFIAKDYSELLNIQLLTSEEADVISALNAFKIEVNKSILKNNIKAEDDRIICNELSNVCKFHLEKHYKIIDHELNTYFGRLYHLNFGSQLKLDIDPDPIEVMNDQFQFIENNGAQVADDWHKIKSLFDHHPKLSLSLQKYIEVKNLYKMLQQESIDNSYINFKNMFMEFKNSAEHEDHFVEQIDAILSHNEKNIIEDISDKILSLNIEMTNTEWDTATEIIRSLQLEVEFYEEEANQTNHTLIAVKGILPYTKFIDEVIHREQLNQKVNLSKNTLNKIINLIKLLTDLQIFVGKSLPNLQARFGDSVDIEEDVISSMVAVFDSKNILDLDSLRDKISQIKLIIHSLPIFKDERLLNWFQDAILIAKNNKKLKSDHAELVDHIDGENFLKKSNFAIALSQKRFIEITSFADEQQVFLDRIKSIDALNSICIEFEIALREQIKEMLPPEMKDQYFELSENDHDPIIKLNRDINNQVEPIVSIISDKNKFWIASQSYLSLIAMQHWLEKGKNSPASAYYALHQFEVEFNKAKNIIKKVNDFSSTKFLNSVVETQESVIILDNACEIFKEKLTNKIKQVLSKENINFYIQYFNPHLSTKTDPVLEIINEVDSSDSKKTAISKLVSENRELRVSLQKYKAVTELKKTLSQKKSPSETIDDFEQKLNEHTKVLNKPDGGLAMSFFRSIARVFGIVLKSSTDEFFSHVGSLFPTSKKRESEEQLSGENKKRKQKT